MSNETTQTAQDAAQYLSFTLDGELFALPIDLVREVVEATEIRRVPRTPTFMRGIINLRGVVVPVMDLKRRLGTGETTMSQDACIIILHTELDGERTYAGLLVDGVQEVFSLAPGEIGPPPKMGTTCRPELIQGIGRRGEDFVVLLQMSQLFAADVLDVGMGEGPQHAAA